MNRFLKKVRFPEIMAAIALLVAFLLLPSCSADKAQFKETTLEDTGGFMELSNGLISLKWDKSDGTLISVKNVKTGTDFLSGSDGENWSAVIDTCTGDKWSSTSKGTGSVKVSGKGIKVVSFEVIDIEEKNKKGKQLSIKQVLSFTHGNTEFKDIVFQQHIKLYDTDSLVGWTVEISNPVQDCTVMSVNIPRLSGIADSDSGWSLAWPYKEGEIRKDAVRAFTDRALVGGYPSPMSMQWMQLFDDKESLYYGVNDKAANFKQFSFGAVNDEVQDAREGCVQMSVTFWPTVGSGEKYLSPVVEIGVFSEGGWYSGADHYRDWLENDAEWVKKLPQISEEFTGMRPWISAFHPGKYTASYYAEPGVAVPLDYAQVIKDVDDVGIDMLCVLGWHENGFDSKYPDYEFIDALGGKDGFVKGVESLHKQGDSIMMYLNSHIADTGSKWYKADDDGDGIKNGEGSAIRDELGKVTHEDYGTGLDYVAMCPSDEGWINKNVDAVRRLRESGVDALWLDQLMEMPAVLCYNREHGHSSPSAAYAEGYKKMMTAFEDAMRSAGDDNFMFSCEGVCDAYLKYIDVCGMMWQRKLGFEEKSAPQLTRYTLPAKIVGLSTFGIAEGERGEYARAFLMGEPFLMNNTINPELKRLTGIYNKEPEIYLKGTYKDNVGLKSTSADIMASFILSADRKSLGLQLYNSGKTSTEAEITISLDELGLDSDIKELYDIETGENLEYNNGIKLPVAAGEIRALKLVLD